MRKLFFFQVLFSITSVSFSQELPLLADKPGTFEILSRTDYTMPECGFTKVEVTSNLERIKAVVAAVRQNPILSDIKGFNGRARIYTMSMTCKEKNWYGVPSRISFEFCSWFRTKDGKETYNTIEPPEWSIYLNDAVPDWADNFNTGQGFFTVPLRKKTIMPGIDVYDGECFVIYDPSRPPYWIPVTVNEAMSCVREDMKNEKDPVAAGYMKDFVEKEFGEIPVSDRNKPAYFGGGVSRISSTPGISGQDSIFPFIMKVNPVYWNKNLPKSAIQLIYFRAVQNKKYLGNLKSEYLKGNSTSYHLVRFEESFGMEDIRRLPPLIGK
jgi:hypothetical protein